MTPCVFVCVTVWQKLLLTSHACPLSTPVLSSNIVIHHAVIHRSPTFQHRNPPLSSSPPPFKLVWPSSLVPFLIPLTFLSLPARSATLPRFDPSVLHFLRRTSLPPNLLCFQPPLLPPFSLLQVFIAACPPVIQTARRETECSLALGWWPLSGGQTAHCCLPTQLEN